MKKYFFSQKRILLRNALLAFSLSTIFTIGCGGGSSTPDPSINDGTAGIGGNAGSAATAGTSGTYVLGEDGLVSLDTNSAAGVVTGGIYIQWTLKLAGTSVSTVELKSFSSQEGIIPSLNGDYAVILSKNGSRIAAYPFQFHTTYIAEGQGVSPQEGQLTGDILTTINIKLDQAIDHLSIVDPSGNVVVETNTLSNGDLLSTLTPSNQAALLSSSEFPWLKYVTNDSVDVAWTNLIRMFGPASARYVREMAYPTQERINYVANELRTASRLSRTAVTHIAFAHFNEEHDLYAVSKGSFILINVDKMSLPAFRGTIVHEAAHCLTYLFENPSRHDVITLWNEGVRNLVRQSIENLHFNVSFSALWEQIQGSAVSNHLSIPYRGESWNTLTDSNAVIEGFAYNYGSRNVLEDIATFVERIQGASLSAAGETPACSAIRGANNNNGLALALPYTKILMLRYAGFIDPEKAHQCVGNTILSGEEGIHFKKPDGTSFDLTIPSVGFLNENGKQYFTISGRNAPLDMFIQIKGRGNRVPPIGIHRLENIALDQINTADRGIFVADDSHAAINTRTSAFGLVVITAVSEDPAHAEGFFMMVGLRNYLGNVTDYFPFGTFKFEP